ncbi:MAG: GumC family protein, partial [bacterium]
RQVTIHDYLAMLYRGRWWILAIFVATVAAVSYYTFTTPPTYQASTTIMIDETQGVGQSLFDFTAYSQQNKLINNQVEILKSRFLARAVVEHLLNAPERDSLQLLQGVGSRNSIVSAAGRLRRLISVSPIRDTDLIRIDVNAPSPFEATFLANSVAESFRKLDRDFSRGEISQVVQFLDSQLERKERDLKASEEALKNFLEQEKIASLSDEATQVVEQGADFESRYKGVLIDLEVNKKRLDYLKGQLGKSKETLETEIARISSPLVLQLRTEMAEIERTITVYLSQGVGEDDPQVRREREKAKAIKSRLTEETRKLIVDGLPSDNPLLQAQELVVSILETQTEITSLSAQAGALKRVVDSYSAKLESLPNKNVRLARLERSRKVDENLYMMMREKYEESRITQAGQIGKVRIIDRALPPGAPISPRTRLNLTLGVLVGLGLGIGFTFLREYLDTSVRRVEDVEEMGLPVLGAIPSIDPVATNGHSVLSNGRHKTDHSGETKGRLVAHFKPKSPVTEAYRTLRTNLQFSESESKLQAFLVSSAGPGEGKSTTTANLAIAMSQQGVRTILVDSDLRRPVQHRLFEIEKSRGLSNILVGKSTLDEAIQATGIENLDALTCGILPPNPSELLGSKRMKDLVAQLKERYEVCLFDSPPLIAVTDAAVLGQELDGVLLVVKSGQTHQDALIRGVELLDNVRARILGVLLNDVSRANTYGSYYYYYYYHYYYYYGEGGDKKKKKKRHGKKSFVDGFRKKGKVNTEA